MTHEEKQKIREAIERPHSWFPDDFEFARKIGSRFAREDELPAAEERQTFGSQKPSLKETR
jgi:hypothetical protein